MGVLTGLQIQDRDDDNDDTSTFWATKANEEAMNQEMKKIAQATRKIISKKISVTENKPTSAPKKLCLCSPTTHAGSFKCRLHRTNNNAHHHKPSSSGNKNIICKNHDIINRIGQARISRFGRAATVAASSSSIHHELSVKLKLTSQ